MSGDDETRVREILATVKPLAAECYRLTGKRVGVTGEVTEYVAAEILGLTLVPARTVGYDALRGKERIQIKGRAYGATAKPGQRMSRIKLDAPCDTVLFVLLRDDGKSQEHLEDTMPQQANGETLRDVSTRYQAERMPTRLCTARVYRSFLNNHVLPKWGDTLIRDVQPRPVELWLRQLPLAPKSKTHVRSLLHSLVDFAMWAGILEIARNPISLVVNKGATKRVRKARSLTVAQFRALLSELREPFSTLALLCVCLGLRMSEALALRWSDVDWLGSRLGIKRGIVERVVDEVKTEASAKTFVLAGDLFARPKTWKQLTRFSGTEDWIFASPVKIGRLPYSYTGVWRDLQRAADASGIDRLGTHSFRHTYRSWLDAVGTPIAVQQKMMRHTDIRTTMNIYGDVVTDEMTTASGKVAQLAFPSNGAQAERSEG